MEQRAVAADACLAQKLARESGKLAHPGRTARRAGGPALAGADGAGQVGDGAADELPADIEAEDEAGIAADLVEDRRAAAAAGAATGALYERGALEVRKGEADGGLRKPRCPRELAARHRPVPSHLLEQELLVQRPHQTRACRSRSSMCGHQLVTAIKIG